MNWRQLEKGHKYKHVHTICLNSFERNDQQYRSSLKCHLEVKLDLSLPLLEWMSSNIIKVSKVGNI